MPYTYQYPRPCVTVDAALISKKSNETEILLIKRGNDPYKGMWALPGGFIEMDETCEDAVVRELEEETSLSGISLMQFKTYSTVYRDPRHRTISVIYFASVDKDELDANPGDDAAEAEWFNINEIPSMAFDHELIIHDLISFL